MFTDRNTRQTKISFRRPSLLVLLRDSGGRWCRLQQSGKFTSYLYGKLLTVNMRLSTFWRHFLGVQNEMSYLISALISCIPTSKLLQKRFGRTVDYVFMLGNRDRSLNPDKLLSHFTYWSEMWVRDLWHSCVQKFTILARSCKIVSLNMMWKWLIRPSIVNFNSFLIHLWSMQNTPLIYIMTYM